MKEGGGGAGGVGRETEEGEDEERGTRWRRMRKWRGRRPSTSTSISWSCGGRALGGQGHPGYPRSGAGTDAEIHLSLMLQCAQSLMLQCTLFSLAPAWLWSSGVGWALVLKYTSH
eukprot:5521050-Pyramimonas_sp.AAC.1